jgi:AsmA protein
MIRDAKSSLGGAPSKGTESQQTDFASITGTATAKDGVLANQDLSAKSPLLRVSGKMGASLPQETIDYKVTATVGGTSKGQAGKGLGDLAGACRFQCT